MALLAGWVFVMQPGRTTNRDCTTTYDEETPVDRWGSFHDPFETREECERVRHEIARRQELNRESPTRRPKWSPLDPLLKLLFPPSTWDECEAVADYWALEHTRCVER
jgi:predicted RNase H-like HicB family nuclease